MSLADGDRTFRSVSGRNIRSEAVGRKGAGCFADTIATALHQEYGHTHAAIKTVVGLTGANKRAVKNWFDATNGPSGEFLIELCRHSDHVLEAFLLLAGRGELTKLKKIGDAKHKLRDILKLIDELESGTYRA